MLSACISAIEMVKNIIDFTITQQMCSIWVICFIWVFSNYTNAMSSLWNIDLIDFRSFLLCKIYSHFFFVHKPIWIFVQKVYPKTHTAIRFSKWFVVRSTNRKNTALHTARPIAHWIICVLIKLFYECVWCINDILPIHSNTYSGTYSQA